MKMPARLNASRAFYPRRAMPTTNPAYAVLTGDLVASSRLDPPTLRTVRNLLEKGIGEAAKWENDLMHGKAEFFQGDAWQLLLRKPACALRLSLFLQAFLRAEGPTRTRISIGLGFIEDLSPKGLGSSTGEAFTLSGRGLERMKNRRCLSLQLPGRAGYLAEWGPLAAEFCDTLVGELTRRQAEVLCHALHPSGLTHEEIRSRLERKVTRQAVTKSLHSLHWTVLRTTLETFEATPWEAVLQPEEKR